MFCLGPHYKEANFGYSHLAMAPTCAVGSMLHLLYLMMLPRPGREHIQGPAMDSATVIPCIYYDQVTCHLSCLDYFLSYVSEDSVYVEASRGYEGQHICLAERD